MKGSLWVWMLQRFSAAILIVLVGMHFSIMHFVDPTVKFDFASSSLRLQGTLYFLVDSAMLWLGLFHGLNGIRNVVLDYWPRAGQAAGWLLGLIGLGFAGYGTTALFAFLN